MLITLLFSTPNTCTHAPGPSLFRSFPNRVQLRSVLLATTTNELNSSTMALKIHLLVGSPISETSTLGLLSRDQPENHASRFVLPQPTGLCVCTCYQNSIMSTLSSACCSSSVSCIANPSTLLQHHALVHLPCTSMSHHGHTPVHTNCLRVAMPPLCNTGHTAFITVLPRSDLSSFCQV